MGKSYGVLGEEEQFSNLVLNHISNATMRCSEENLTKSKFLRGRQDDERAGTHQMGSVEWNVPILGGIMGGQCERLFYNDAADIMTDKD